MKIVEISPSETLPIRNEILRPGEDIQQCVFEGDSAPDTRHFGAQDGDGTIVGIVSVYRKGNPSISSGNTFQIRAMATLPNVRKKGVGRLLVAAAENHASTEGASFIWANARSTAVDFYVKSGYTLASAEFLIEGVGAHHLVVKSLAGPTF